MPLEAPASAPAVETWRTERIVLPPDFAPQLPRGEEHLLFAPGMFDRAAEDFWSYAFSLQVDLEALDEGRLAELLEAYFDGLLRTVAEGRGEDIGDDPAQVSLMCLRHGDYEAWVNLIDAFVTLEPLALRLLIHVNEPSGGGTLIEVQASPQSPQHWIWSQLEAAAQRLEHEAQAAR